MTDKPVPHPSALAGELHRLAMRWRASGRWPAQTTAYMRRLLGQDVCAQGLERALWELRHPSVGAAHSISIGNSGGLHSELLDMIRVRLRQEHAAHVWCEAFLRAQFPELSREQMDKTRLLQCLDENAIDPGAYARSTYLPGESRELAADEVMLDGSSIFDEASVLEQIFESEDSVCQTQALRGVLRQVLARIRRDTERSAYDYGAANSALLQIGPVLRSMKALELETDWLYIQGAKGFAATEAAARLAVALPIARHLPDVIAARVDDLSNASSRVRALEQAAGSTNPLSTRLAAAGQHSALLGIQRSAWDAMCRLLLFPDAVIAGAGLGARTHASLAGHGVDSAFDKALSADQQRQRTTTFALDQASHDSQDQIHGSIAGYALGRLVTMLPPGTAAGFTQRWCRAWADLMTVCTRR